MNEFITKPTIQKQIDQLSKTHNSRTTQDKNTKTISKKISQPSKSHKNSISIKITYQSNKQTPIFPHIDLVID